MAPRATYRVNGPALWALLDAKRREDGLSWRGVARVSGCATGALFTRLQRDDVSLHADAFVSLLAWLGLDGQIRSLIAEANPVPDEPTGPSTVDRLTAVLTEANVAEVQEAFERIGSRVTYALEAAE